MIALHLINESPNCTIDCCILEEIWNGRKSSYGHLRVLSYEAYVHVPKELWILIQRNAFSWAMVLVVRWDTIYEMLTLTRSLGAMM